MNINSINFTPKPNEVYKNCNNKNSKISFSDKLKKEESKADTDTNGYSALLNEINNEPENDREEDMKFYEYLKCEKVNCKGKSLQWEKDNSGLVVFPPINVPGHVRSAYENCLEKLPISDEEKGQITFKLANECAFGIYKGKQSNNISYNIDIKNLIRNLLNYNENYNKKNPNDISLYENTKLLLNDFLNSLN